MGKILKNYKVALGVLLKKPVLLWGLSLLSMLLMMLIAVFGLIPLIVVPVVVTLEASLYMLFYKGLKGEEVSSADLFTGFSNFKHVAGGMLWAELWVIIWGLIPIVGPIFAIIKSYEYRFTPFILMTRPEIGATDAIKESKKMTYGIKGSMFGADIFIALGFYVIVLVLSLFAQIPYIGVLFGIALFVLYVLYVALCPIFYGLVMASYYDNALPKESPIEIEVAPIAPEV